MRKHVLIIPDGAADTNCERGMSPLEAAHTPFLDFIADKGVCGQVQTLYPHLPKESMVAQLGMLGWDPRIYYPGGRASAELLASAGIRLETGDLALRANFVRMEGMTLASYSAGSITSTEALPLVARIGRDLGRHFSSIELHHNSDFRNTLLVRNARVRPNELFSPEPHESHGRRFCLQQLVKGRTTAAANIANHINAYLTAAAELLQNECANALFPWSPSGPLALPPFGRDIGIRGRVGVVAFMDFLIGIAKAANLDFVRVGNGRPDTNYAAKGQTVLEMLKQDYLLVVCHVNAPDEASHTGDLDAKIQSLESIDRDIVAPIIAFFIDHPHELGGVMVVPDHYSNTRKAGFHHKRSESHSLEPVPFAMWNNGERDECSAFDERHTARGRYAGMRLTHLDLLPLMVGSHKLSVASAGR